MAQRKEFIKYMIVLTMMSTMGLLASDIYIPAMPNLTQSLDTSFTSIQLTLGIYLLGLSVFQLFAGPLSDRYGRRRILLIGFVLYTVASLGCALSYNISQLIVFRFLQAIGACTGLVVGRATISDQFSLKQSAGIYNIVYPLVASSPALAPLIGGYLATWFNWRATFMFVVVYGIVLIVLSWFWLKETHTRDKRHADRSLLRIFLDLPKILNNPTFLSYLFCICAIYGAWFTYLSQSTFIFGKMGYVQHIVGYFYIPLAVMIYVGNIFSKILIKYFQLYKVFLLGLVFFASGALLFLINNYWSQHFTAMSLILPMSIVSIANGILLPLGIPLAISLFPNQAGSASAIVGCFQIGTASLCASFIGKWFGLGYTVLAWGVFTLAVVAILGHWLLVTLAKPPNTAALHNK